MGRERQEMKRIVFISIIAIISMIFVFVIAEENLQISFDSENFSVAVGGNIRINAISSQKGRVNLEWSSSDDKIATVSSKGVVNGISAGSVQITATSADDANVSAVCTVTVSVPVKKIMFSNKSIEVYENDTQEITATVFPENATNKDLLWSSTNEKVATVNDHGIITGISTGNAKIIVTAADGYKAKAILNIKVTKKIDSMDILFENPWGASIGSIQFDTKCKKTKKDDTVILTYSPKISNLKSIQMIYVKDKLMGSIVSMKGTDGDRYNMLVRNLNDIFGTGYPLQEDIRLSMALRDFYDICSLPKDNSLLSYNSEKTMGWANDNTIVLLLMNKRNDCKLLISTTINNDALYTEENQFDSGNDTGKFQVRGASWGVSQEEIKELEKKYELYEESKGTLSFEIPKKWYFIDVTYLFMSDKLIGVYFQAADEYIDELFADFKKQYGNSSVCNTDEFLSSLSKRVWTHDTTSRIANNLKNDKDELKVEKIIVDSTNIYYVVHGPYVDRYIFFFQSDEELKKMMND